jgi:hypothetical protein
VAGLAEKHVPSADDFSESLGIAAGIGMAASDRSAKCPHHLLPISAFRHTQDVVRLASALPANVAAHR